MSLTQRSRVVFLRPKKEPWAHNPRVLERHLFSDKKGFSHSLLDLCVAHRTTWYTSQPVHLLQTSIARYTSRFHVPADQTGWHYPNPDKAGATFAEALGDGTQTQNADRIIHAIDGLRKSHDEDKGLQKGLLTSVQGRRKDGRFLGSRMRNFDCGGCRWSLWERTFPCWEENCATRTPYAPPHQVAGFDDQSCVARRGRLLVGRDRRVYAPR